MKHTTRAKGTHNYIQLRFHVVLQGRYEALIKPVFCNFPFRDFQGRLIICCRGHVAESKTVKKTLFCKK